MSFNFSLPLSPLSPFTSRTSRTDSHSGKKRQPPFEQEVWQTHTNRLCFPTGDRMFPRSKDIFTSVTWFEERKTPVLYLLAVFASCCGSRIWKLFLKGWLLCYPKRVIDGEEGKERENRETQSFRVCCCSRVQGKWSSLHSPLKNGHSTPQNSFINHSFGPPECHMGSCWCSSRTSADKVVRYAVMCPHRCVMASLSGCECLALCSCSPWQVPLVVCRPQLIPSTRPNVALLTSLTCLLHMCLWDQPSKQPLWYGPTHAPRH